jgi:hypothetical protein
MLDVFKPDGPKRTKREEEEEEETISNEEISKRNGC